MTSFRRARSAEQREERRRAILATTAAMLAEMPVAAVSLNEISRRVGLAKSNVLRYVESREEALLALLDGRAREWLDAVDAAAVVTGTPRERVDRFADAVARSLAERPVLCDLVAAQSAVLEHNVSAAVAGRHKRRTLEAVDALGAVARRHVPELRPEDLRVLAGATLLCAGTVWTGSRPSAGMSAAYDADPALAALRLDFVDTLRALVATLASGLLARAAED